MQEAQGELPISQSNPDAQTSKDSNVPEVAENGSVEDNGKVEKEAVDERRKKTCQLIYIKQMIHFISDTILGIKGNSAMSFWNLI